MQAKRRVQLLVPAARIGEPLIYEMGKSFKVIPNIRRANITDNEGWIVMEISGENSEIDKALQHLESKGVKVSAAEGDLVEG